MSCWHDSQFDLSVTIYHFHTIPECSKQSVLGIQTELCQSYHYRYYNVRHVTRREFEHNWSSSFTVIASTDYAIRTQVMQQFTNIARRQLCANHSSSEVLYSGRGVARIFKRGFYIVACKIFADTPTL